MKNIMAKKSSKQNTLIPEEEIKIWKPDGEEILKNMKIPLTLTFIQKIVEGYYEPLYLPNTEIMLMNESPTIKQELNTRASEYILEIAKKTNTPLRYSPQIMGTIILCSPNALK